MREACRMSAEIRDICAAAVAPGVTTGEIDDLVVEYCKKHNVGASFFEYPGGRYAPDFPGHLCVSLNDEVIHGIPGSRKIVEGDIVSVDTGALIDGYYGDSCKTFACGKIDPEVQALLDSTEESLMLAIDMVKPGVRIGDIGAAIQKYNEERGFSVVREFVGHGLGRDMHEEPEVPNFGTAGKGIKLQAGMVICIEPMINMGTAAIKIMPDGWTVKTQDGKWSAHFEHAIAVTQTGCVILSRLG